MQIQRGSGSDDGAYIHRSEYVGGFAGFTNPSTVNFDNPFPEGVFWADIDVSTKGLAQRQEYRDTYASSSAVLQAAQPVSVTDSNTMCWSSGIKIRLVLFFVTCAAQ